MATLPKGEVMVLREFIAPDGILCRQWETIDLSDVSDKEDAKPDKARIKDALGVSSQEKGENVSILLMGRILGTEAKK